MENPWRTTRDLQVVEELGHGDFGTVYKAFHTIDGCHYAIKQVPIDNALRYFDGNVDKLFAEVKVLQKINSTNVIRYHNCWVEGDDVETLPQESTRMPQSYSSGGDPPPDNKFLFIHMELCDSSNLKKWLRDHPTIESRLVDFPEIFNQLALGLKAIHDLNIIHRDLKPDNIFSKVVKEREGQRVLWKIGDFGLSSKPPEDEVQSFDHVTSAAGSEMYRSPDIEVSTKSDVYTLGIIFLEVLYPSFRNREMLGMLYDWRNFRGYKNKHFEPEVEVKKLISASNPKECEVICRMLNLDPRERINVNQVLKMLNIEANLQLWFEVGKSCSNFVGRKDEMTKLQTSFQNQSPLISVISGLGGIGKSELVKKFAENVFKNDPTASCIWLEGDNTSSLHRSITKLSQRTEITISDSEEHIVHNFMTIYLNRLKNTQTLLIIDNVDKVNHDVLNIIRSFKRLGPTTRLPFIIITTRNLEVFSKIGGGFTELKVLETENAIELVTKLLPSVPIEDAKSLCHILQNYPLALQQAICFIQERQRRSETDGFDIPNFLKLFNKRRAQVLEYGLSLENHDYSLTTLTTWKVSFENIKSVKEIGPIAEKLFKLMAYALDAEHETVEFIINLYNKLDDNNQEEEEDESDSDNSDEGIDLDFDNRPVAKALQLIRSFSMCNIEKFKIGNTNEQVTAVSIHRLVQEVIRVNLRGSNLEKEWLLTLGRSLIRLDWNNMSNIDSNISEGDLRGLVRVTKNAWKSISKHKSIIPELKQVFVPIWESGGLLLNSDINFLDTTRTHLKKVIGEDDLVTMILDYNFYLHLLKDLGGSVRYIYKTDIGQVQYQSCHVIKLYFRQKEKLVPHPHKLTIQTLELLKMDAFIRGLKYGFPIASAAKIFIDSVVRKVIDEPGSHIECEEMFKFLCLVGRILEAYRFLKLFDKLTNFTSEFMEIFTENLEEAVHFSYLIRYIGIFLSEELENQNGFSGDFLDKALKLPGINLPFQNCLSSNDVEIVRGFFQYNFDTGVSVPYSVQRMLYSDSLNFVYADFDTCELRSFLTCVWDRDQFDKHLQLGKKILEVCFDKCVEEKFEYAIRLLTQVKDAEKRIWESGRVKDSLEICQRLVRLCKFRGHWDDEEVVVYWIDDLLERIGEKEEFYERSFSILKNIETFEINLASDFNGFSTLISEISEISRLIGLGYEIVRRLVIENVDMKSEPLSSVSLLSRLVILIGNLIWFKEGYIEWQNLMVYASLQLKQNGFEGYFEYKVSQDAIKNVIEPCSKIPTSVLTWTCIFILKHSSRLADIPNSHLIFEKIVERLEIGDNSEESSSFLQNLSTLSSKILVCCDNISDFELSRSRLSYVIPRETTPPVRLVHGLSRLKNITPQTYCEELSDLESSPIIKSYISEEPEISRRDNQVNCDVGGHLYNGKWSTYSRPDISLEKFLAPKKREVIQFPSTKYPLIRQNFWFILYSLGVVGEKLRKAGKFEEDIELFQKALRLTEERNSKKENIITRQLALIEYLKNWKTGRSSQSLSNLVFCQLIRQNWQHRIQFTDSELIHNTIRELQLTLLKYIQFKEFIEFHDKLMELESEFLQETGLPETDNLKPKFIRIAGALKWLRVEHKRNHPFHINLFETALKVSKRPETRSLIDNEITKIVMEIIESDLDLLVISEEFNVQEGIELFKLILKSGPESDKNEILLKKILDILLQTKNFSDLHGFAFQIGYVPVTELKLESLCCNSIELMLQYMRNACQVDVEGFKRSFNYSKSRYGNYTLATKITGLNNMEQFVSGMSRLTQEFNL